MIFDGYPNANSIDVSSETSAATPLSSTKVTERSRRKNATITPYVQNFNGHIKISFTPDMFLSNENNTNKLIQLLSAELRTAGFYFAQAQEDADTLIVNTARELAKNDKTIDLMFYRKRQKNSYQQFT